MKASQRRVPGSRTVSETLRCFVVCGFLTSAFFLTNNAFAERGESVHDYAKVYLDQYFEPDLKLILSEKGRKKSAALANYALGRSLEARGRALEAVEAYKAVLENAPGQHFLARKTANLLARNGGNDEALELLEENLKANPDEPFAYISLSEYLATYRNSDEDGRMRSFSVIEDALQKFPSEAAVYEHYVRLLVVNNRKAEARRVFEQALSIENSDPRFWLELGRISGQIWPVRAGSETDESKLVNTLYGKALFLAEEDPAVVEKVGDFYHTTRQFDRAIQAYVAVITASPDRLDVREKLAKVYGGKGDEEKVISTLGEILEIDPKSARTHKQLAQIYMRNEKFKEAIPHLRKSLAITKGTATEYNALARMMIESDEYEAAIEFLKDAAYQFPDLPDFSYLMSFPLSTLERWDESVEQFEKTIELAGDEQPQMLNESFYFRYAAATERGGDLEKAAKLFRKTIELISKQDPEDQDKEFTATVYNYLGYMWVENDMKIDEAGELIKTAADLDPESGAIADSLGWFYFKKGKYEEAKTELLRAEQMIETPDAVIYDHIGQAFFKLGEMEKAIAYMERAVELDPEKEEYSDRLAEYEKGADSKPADNGKAKDGEQAAKKQE